MFYWSFHNNRFFINDSGDEPSHSSYSIRQAISKCYESGDVRKGNNQQTKSFNDHSCMYQQQIMFWGVSFLSCYLFLIYINILTFLNFFNRICKILLFPFKVPKILLFPLLISKIHVFPRIPVVKVILL